MSKKIHTIYSSGKIEFENRVNYFLELGYTENKIKNMTPQQGWDNIKKGKKK